MPITNTTAGLLPFLSRHISTQKILDILGRAAESAGVVKVVLVSSLSLSFWNPPPPPCAVVCLGAGVYLTGMTSRCQSCHGTLADHVIVWPLHCASELVNVTPLDWRTIRKIDVVRGLLQ